MSRLIVEEGPLVSNILLAPPAYDYIGSLVGEEINKILLRDPPRTPATTAAHYAPARITQIIFLHGH